MPPTTLNSEEPAKPVFDGPDRKEVGVVTREGVAVLKALGRYGSTRTELPNQGL